MSKLSDFTIVLLRPQFIADSYGRQLYVAHIQSIDSKSAVEAALQEVFEADNRDGLAALTPIPYELCVMFNGHHDPL